MMSRAGSVDHARWIPPVYPSSITAYRDRFAGSVPSLIGKPEVTGMHQVG